MSLCPNTTASVLKVLSKLFILLYQGYNHQMLKLDIKQIVKYVDSGELGHYMMIMLSSAHIVSRFSLAVTNVLYKHNV